MKITLANTPVAEGRQSPSDAKIKAFREAAQAGWDDIEAGRYIDLEDHELDAFLDGLGQAPAR